jgi:hypothetical protein
VTAISSKRHYRLKQQHSAPLSCVTERLIHSDSSVCHDKVKQIRIEIPRLKQEDIRLSPYLGGDVALFTYYTML